MLAAAHWPGALLALLSICCTATAQETIRVTSRDELVRGLAEAKPGTTISVAPGNYRGGLSLAGLKGTKERPIVVTAVDANKPPVFEGGGSGMHLSSPEYLELRDLIFSGATGNGLNIDDGGSVESPAHHVVLRNLVVRDVGPEGNRDGIKLSGLDDFRIENCRVERWGSGGSAIDMVGCHRGVITGCTFRDGADQANGVQAKGGSRQIVIERCRFENAGGRAVNAGGSTGLPYFRPRDADSEAKEITVRDCEFLGGMSAVAFVGVDGALVEHNTIYRPKRWVLRILQENTADRFVHSRNGRFVNNIVVFRADEVRQVVNIGGSTSPETFEFAGNVWHCLDRPADTQRLLQLPVRETGGTYGTNPGLKNPDRGDLSTSATKTSAGVRPATRKDTP